MFGVWVKILKFAGMFFIYWKVTNKHGVPEVSIIHLSYFANCSSSNAKVLPKSSSSPSSFKTGRDFSFHSLTISLLSEQIENSISSNNELCDDSFSLRFLLSLGSFWIRFLRFSKALISIFRFWCLFFSLIAFIIGKLVQRIYRARELNLR